MSSPFVAQICMFGGNYAPRNFAFCNGQTLSIAQNTALFSLLGTTYGGNGINTFQLPNLQSQLALHYGQGIGLSPYALGGIAGVPTVTLTTQQMPNHTHPLNATQTTATAGQIANNLLPGQPTANNPAPNPPQFYASQIQGQPALVPVPLAPSACSTVGGNQPHSNLMPSLCVSFIIALQGIFPSRN